jgi:hypothetical protein
MNVILYGPLLEAALLVAPLAAALDGAALVAPDAAVDELDDDDEHAAAPPSSNAAAAPAAGIDKDRFIPAPSREFWVLPPVPRMAQGARTSVRRRACYIPPTGLFSFWQPRGNIWLDRAAAMSPMSRKTS